MNSKFILDTSALLTFYEGEAGKERIESLFNDSKKGIIEVLVPFAVAIEFYYINYKNRGEDIANQRLALLMSLPVKLIIEINEAFMIQAGTFKVNYNISFADSLVASYAFIEKAILVHKDAEFIPLEDRISLETLPLK